MTTFLAALILAQQNQIIPLWPNGAPGSESRKDEPEVKPHPWSLNHIYNPSITVYAPPALTANGTAIVIAAGGGHTELEIEPEGTQPAQFFNSLGITAFVLKYRLFREKGSGLTFEKDTTADTFRAMRLVRSRASEWGVDPNKIGMIGFSAGGENLSAAVFGPGKGDPAAPDPIDREDEHPNFAIWVYPGGLGIPETPPADLPPAFLVVANDDDHTTAVLKVVDLYRKAKAKMELHILGEGGHGFGLAKNSKFAAVHGWTDRLTDWLADNGLILSFQKRSLH
jgi:acetyl esterase/lipase